MRALEPLCPIPCPPALRAETYIMQTVKVIGVPRLRQLRSRFTGAPVC